MTPCEWIKASSTVSNLDDYESCPTRICGFVVYFGLIVGYIESLYVSLGKPSKDEPSGDGELDIVVKHVGMNNQLMLLGYGLLEHSEYSVCSLARLPWQLF